MRYDTPSLERWNSRAYDSSFGYVSTQGAPLVDLLDPQPGERVLDLGLRHRRADRRRSPSGAPRSSASTAPPAMIEKALAQYPGIDFIVGDGHDFTVARPYDAVFSNAALHWMSRDPAAVIASVREALTPGGRFVAEMGGAGNCAELTTAMLTAWREYGLREPELPWYFPTPAEYARRLEQGGLHWSGCWSTSTGRPRSTSAPAGPPTGCACSPARLLEGLPPDLVEPLLQRVNELAAPALRRETGWMADYVRLRFAAVRR